MTCHHNNPAIQRVYERLVKRVPSCAGVDFSLVNNLHDLRFQLESAIDLYTDSEHQATIRTARQLHAVKMLLADVCIAIQDERNARAEVR